MPIACEGKKNIVHYALYKKPWQDDDVTDGEYFWTYAERSPFYPHICRVKNSFGDEDKAKKQAAAKEIIEHALKIAESNHTFSKKLLKR